MIVRILGEGQLKVDDTLSAELNELDAKLQAALNAGDEKAFRLALEGLLARVRAAGTPIPADSLEAVGCDLAVFRGEHGRRACPAY